NSATSPTPSARPCATSAPASACPRRLRNVSQVFPGFRLSAISICFSSPLRFFDSLFQKAGGVSRYGVARMCLAHFHRAPQSGIRDITLALHTRLLVGYHVFDVSRKT